MAAKNVSARADLPGRFSDLKLGCLTVINFGPNGVEPSYTNLCGLSSEWCITGLGGGDYVTSGLSLFKMAFKCLALSKG